MMQAMAFRDVFTGPAPPSAGRIVGLDVARAIAICLMILENFKVMLLANGEEPHWLVWLVGLADGRSAPLFVTLAGVGISLMSKPARASGDPSQLTALQGVLLKRALFFLVVGNLFILVWYMDILHFYAWYVALGAFLLVGSSPRRLFAAAVVILVASSVTLAAWGDEFFVRYDYWTPLNMVRNTFFDGIHPVFPWFVFVIVGMWIGQLRLDDHLTRRKLLWGALAVFVGAEVLSDFTMELTFHQVWNIVPASLPHHLGTRLTPPGPFYIIAASATSVAGIAACLMLADARPRSTLIRAFTSAGQLSLTLYIGHAVVGWGLLWLLGRDEDRSILFLWAYWGAYTALSVAFAHWYRQRWKFGPLEWMMRKLTGSAPRLPLSEEREAPVARGGRWILLAKLVTIIGVPWLLAYTLMGLDLERGCGGHEQSIRPGEAQTNELTVTCRERWFELHLSDENGPRQVLLTSTSGADTYLEVFNSDITNPQLIAEDDDSGPGYCPRLETTLEPGRYLVKVRPYSSSTGPFVLRVE